MTRPNTRSDTSPPAVAMPPAGRPFGRRLTASPVLWLTAPLVLLLVLYFLLPLALLLSNSFLPVVLGQPSPPGLTAANYARFLGDVFYLRYLGATLVLGALVTILATLTGYPVAYALARSRHRWKTPLRLLVIAPLLVSVVIRAYGWIALLANNGAVNNALIALRLIREPIKFMFTYTGVTIGLVHFALPVAILSLVGVIEAIDASLEDAARGLGAGAAQTFFRITLPLSLPGIAAGSMLVFSLTVAAFVRPALMGGPSVTVLSTLIYEQMTVTLDWGFGAAATILLVVSAGLFLLDEPLSNLDLKLREEMRGEIRSLQKALGISTIFVTHDQEEALTMGDEIVVMNQGRIVQSGAPTVLYDRPASRFAAHFIGESNLESGKVREITGPGTWRVDAGGLPVGRSAVRVHDPVSS